MGIKQAALICIYVHLATAVDYCYRNGNLETTCDEDEHCCDDNYRCCVDEMEVGDIIGIVIGCLCYIACTAGFIVLIMKLAKRKPGTVVHSQPTGPVTVASIQGQHPPGPQFGPQHGVQPPAYSQQPSAPPMYPGGAGPGVNQQYPPPDPFQPQGQAVYPPPPPAKY